MKCSDIENKLVDYLDGVLSMEEVSMVEEHLVHCKPCEQILEETKALFDTFHKMPAAEPDEAMRPDFLKVLEEEKQLLRSEVRSIRKKEFPWKIAFQIAASLLLLIGGYAMGSFREGARNNEQIAALQQETVALKQSMMLAMLDNRSVSKRIQAVSYSEDISTPDEEVLEALIDRLHFDGSVNVRLAAAEALSKYSENEKVKNAFIKSLTNEKNPNIQITVIQFLVDIQDKRALAPMQQLLEQTETPDYVKEQVSAGLQQLI